MDGWILQETEIIFPSVKQLFSLTKNRVGFAGDARLYTNIF